MNFTYKLASRISKFMKSKGFTRRGKLYYRIQDNIAYCICFESPSGKAYTWFFVMPLFIPSEYVYLSYGNRLENLCRFPSISKDSADEELELWVHYLMHVLEEKVFPYFERIGSASSLLEYIQQEYLYICEYVCTSPCNRGKLETYLSFYLGDREAFIKAAEKYRGAIDHSSFFPQLKNKWLERLDELERIIMNDPSQIESYCRGSISFTMQHCFSPKKREPKMGEGSPS